MKELNRWNAEQYNKNADFVSKLALQVVELLNPQKDENILDLGCGDGSLAVEIQKKDCKVIGIDLSADMVAKSKERGIESYIMNVTEFKFNKKFDAVFSNAVLHWVKDASSAIKSVESVLTQDGRFVGEFGGDGNIKALREAMQQVFESNPKYGKFHNPWYFPTKEEYTKLLEHNGFRVKLIEVIPRPTSIGDIKEWLDIFANGIMQNVPQILRENFKNEVQELLKPQFYTQKDGWVVDYVRLRFFAIKVG